MSSSATFTINGSATTAAIVTTAGATVTVALVSTTGVRAVKWRIVAGSDPDEALPTFADDTATSTTFAMNTPVGSEGLSFIVECVINNGVDDAGQVVSSYTATGIVGVVNASGKVPFALGEKFERHNTHGIVPDINSLWALVSGSDATAWRGITIDNTTFSAPNDGDIPVYDSGTGTWLAGAPSSFTLTWAQVLADGALSGGSNPRISAGDAIEFIDATRSLTATAGTGIIADIPTGETYDLKVNTASKLTVGAAVTVASGVQLQIGDNQRYITTGAVNGVAYHSGITGAQVHEFFTNNTARLELAALNATFKTNGYVLRWHNSVSSPYDVLKGLNGDVTLSAESGRSLTLSGATISLTGLSHLAIGTDPADTGTVRLPALGSIYGEASPTGADVPMIAVDAAEAVIVGGDAGATGVQLRATTSLGGYVGGGQIFAATASAFTYHQPLTSSGTTATLATSAGTWLTGTTALATVVGDLACGGGTHATLGALRFANNKGWYTRNAANTANIRTALIDGSDNIVLGDNSVAGANTFVFGNTQVHVRPGGSDTAIFTSTAIQAQSGKKFDTASGTAALSIGGTDWMTGTVALTTVVGDLAFGGGTVATGGDLRAASQFTFSARNNGNTSNLTLLRTDAADSFFAGSSNVPNTLLEASSTVRARIGSDIWITRTTELELQSGINLQLLGTGKVDFAASTALGGGAGATLGTIGGSGPTAAAQASWVPVLVGGVAGWMPLWV